VIQRGIVIWYFIVLSILKRLFFHLREEESFCFFTYFFFATFFFGAAFLAGAFFFTGIVLLG
jgi:hypothetical protein